MADADTVDFACQLADLARRVVLPYFGTPLTLHRKDDDSPVTRADREAEAAMRERIESRYPDDGIHGEEFGVVGADRERVWVLDPIDGTKSFITGKPLFGTLIALLEGGRPVLGVVDMPALGRRWLGVSGQPSLADGAACRVSGQQSIADVRLAATSIDMFAGDDRARFDALSRQVWFRTFGSDCFAYAMLASGFLDLVVEADLSPYDYLAMVPLIEGAGGCISDWSGAPLGLASDGRVLASASPGLHAAALATLAG